jgi:hypothetical protein
MRALRALPSPEMVVGVMDGQARSTGIAASGARN